jgi:hypothetical protein
MVCILGYTKLIKSEKFIVLKYALFSIKFIRIYYFYVVQNMKYSLY